MAKNTVKKKKAPPTKGEIKKALAKLGIDQAAGVFTSKDIDTAQILSYGMTQSDCITLVARLMGAVVRPEDNT